MHSSFLLGWLHILLVPGNSPLVLILGSSSCLWLSCWPSSRPTCQHPAIILATILAAYAVSISTRMTKYHPCHHVQACMLLCRMLYARAAKSALSTWVTTCQPGSGRSPLSCHSDSKGGWHAVERTKHCVCGRPKYYFSRGLFGFVRHDYWNLSPFLVAERQPGHGE